MTSNKRTNYKIASKIVKLVLSVISIMFISPIIIRFCLIYPEYLCFVMGIFFAFIVVNIKHYLKEKMNRNRIRKMIRRNIRIEHALAQNKKRNVKPSVTRKAISKILAMSPSHMKILLKSLVTLQIFITISFQFVISINNINLPDNNSILSSVPVTVGSTYWYEVSDIGFWGRTTTSKWKVDVQYIEIDIKYNVWITVFLSEYPQNILERNKQVFINIPRTKNGYYNASPYIFFTNKNFPMWEGSTKQYFYGGHPWGYIWHRDGSSFSEEVNFEWMNFETHVTYKDGILQYFEYSYTDHGWPMGGFRMQISAS